MKILVVEDDRRKKKYLEEFLKARNIDMHHSKSIRPAIRYALKYSTEISGIILDLGLTSYDNSNDYEFDKGLELIKELTQRKVKIPILINSSTYISIQLLMEINHNVKGQMYNEDDDETLRWFINLLANR